jgi:hypothetical protein
MDRKAKSIPLEETPIFLQLTQELYPEWFYPVRTREVVVNGRKGVQLVDNPRDIWKMKKPPWL